MPQLLRKTSAISSLTEAWRAMAASLRKARGRASALISIDDAESHLSLPTLNDHGAPSALTIKLPAPDAG
jgi:hypothetical protein